MLVAGQGQVVAKDLMEERHEELARVVVASGLWCLVSLFFGCLYGVLNLALAERKLAMPLLS